MDDFKTGDVVGFAGEEFVVIKNYGGSGVVAEYPTGSVVRFKWDFQGEKTQFLRSNDESKALAKTIAVRIKL